MHSIIGRTANHFAMKWCSSLSKLSKERGKVLMFHNIGNPDGELNLDVPAFERILQNTDWGGQKTLVEWETAVTPFTALTFDDVMESFYTNAYPLLKKYRAPFTLFINLSLLDTPGYLSLKNLKELAADPLCTIGSHGMNHTYFAKYTKEEALQDMRESKEKLRQMTSQPVELFAFPYGSFAACGWRTHKLVRQVYHYGFSTINAPITKKMLLPKGFLPRINVDNHTIKHIEL